MYTTEFPDRESHDFALLAVQHRLEELRLYHLNHPELPRQDDVAAIYERAQAALDQPSLEVQLESR